MDSIRRWARHALVATVVLALAACGAGGGNGDGAPGTGSPVGDSLTAVPPPTETEAARFLAKATFGGTATEIKSLSSMGYAAWFGDQFSRGAPGGHQAYFDSQAAAAALAGQSTNQHNWVYESFWQGAVAGDDPLRQRVAFALSQIFVVSLVDSNVGNHARGVASYMDTLGRNAFGNFRTLLEEVSLHPMMGLYLSHLRNQKEDPARGRVPDENYAREVMQLFTIGLYQLESDGTVRLDTRREPIPTYGNDDVTGLAKVFTGWSWAGPDKSDSRFYGGSPDPERAVTRMQSYPKFHSTAAKSFLGTTIGAQGGADPQASLRAALDHLFNHPNVGPFIGKQLIQRLVTSNPSPAYVRRVAAAFANNGNGVRGDMRAVITAVLMDPEARDPLAAADPKHGRLREPIARMAQWMRVFGAKSTSGRFLIGSTDDAAGSLGQTAMRSPSVFNFYRPGYVPPGTPIGDAGLVAPELQITHETSVAGYVNTMRVAVDRGFGSGSPRDVQPDYTAELELAGDPARLVDRINLLLMNGAMPNALYGTIRDAVASVTIPTSGTAAPTARRNRVLLAIFLTMASPEYLVQK